MVSYTRSKAHRHFSICYLRNDKVGDSLVLCDHLNLIIFLSRKGKWLKLLNELLCICLSDFVMIQPRVIVPLGRLTITLYHKTLIFHWLACFILRLRYTQGVQLFDSCNWQWILLQLFVVRANVPDD